MQKLLLLTLLLAFSLRGYSQGFEVFAEPGFKGGIGETVKAPLRIRNTTDKPQNIIIRRVQATIGSTQRYYFCIDGTCNEDRQDEILVRLEPGQILSSVQIALEGGLISEHSILRYIAFNRAAPSQSVEFELNFSIEEKSNRNKVYESRFISVNDIYPNPCTDHAFLEYSLTSDRVKAKVRIHNILGNVMGEYELSPLETSVRIKTDDLTSGIYFYTLILDNESVMTRKIIVKK